MFFKKLFLKVFYCIFVHLVDVESLSFLGSRHQVNKIVDTRRRKRPITREKEED